MKAIKDWSNSDKISLLNFASSLILGLSMLFVSINTYNLGIYFHDRKDVVAKREAITTAHRVYTISSMIIQNEPKQEQAEYVKGELNEIVMLLESQLNNEYLNNNDTLHKKWHNLLTQVFFYQKYFWSLGDSSIYYRDYWTNLLEVDSLSQDLFTESIKVEFD